MPHASIEQRREYYRNRYLQKKAADPFYWRKRDADYIRALRLKRKQTDPIKHKRLQMVQSAKARAIKAGVSFEIGVDDVPFTPICPVLGITLDWSSSKCCPASPSLDRLDSALGYTPDNINVISHRANSIKNNATAEELIAVAHWIKQHADD